MLFRGRFLRFVFAIFFPFSLCQAHTPHPFSKKNKYLINEPVINLHEACAANSSFVSQGVYGHSAYVVQELEDGWALVETEDGYQGYAQLSGLAADNPRWKTSKRLVCVSSVCGMVYPIADTERPALLKLPFGARVEVVEEFDANNDRWLRVVLVDGTQAWMQRGDLEKPKTRSLKEMIQLSYKFLERPYVWGGSSSEGFDCSGYVQTICKQMGVLLPRDSRPQASSEKVIPLDAPSKPGDLVFFGNSRIAHVGLYLGDDQFIHAGVRDHTSRIAISTLGETDYHFQQAARVKKPTFQATISTIKDDIKAKMAHSWREDNPVSLKDLRYLQLNHWGYDGCVHDGELVVHAKVAEEVVDIFAELFAKQYPIEKMLLIDAYQADEDLSCEDNNTSAFCSRPVTGSATELSAHSFGLAIDINPLLNPYHNKAWREDGIIRQEFLDRTLDCRGLLTDDDACVQAFLSRGWKWGGHWAKERGYVDYQHFYKESSKICRIS